VTVASPEQPVTRELGTRGRAARLAIVAVVGIVLVLGSWKGSDDSFPFGPFSMFAGFHQRDSYVPSTFVRGTTVEGVSIRLGSTSTGMRRAEVEGQVGQYMADPSRLQDIARAVAAKRPELPALRDVSVVQHRYLLKNGGVVGETDVVLATWTVRA
jgi:hypothetical protein